MKYEIERVNPGHVEHHTKAVTDALREGDYNADVVLLIYRSDLDNPVLYLYLDKKEGIGPEAIEALAQAGYTITCVDRDCMPGTRKPRIRLELQGGM